MIPRVLMMALLGAATAAQAADGLEGRYYAGSAVSGAPTLVRIDATVDFDWGSDVPAAGLPADQFSVRWAGTVTAPITGAWTFTTVADDGVMLSVDGQTIVDDWSDHSARDASGTVTLQAGQPVEIAIAYYERGGQAVARLHWQGPGTPREPVPTSALRTPAAFAAQIPSTSATSPASIAITNRTGAALHVAPGRTQQRILAGDRTVAEVPLLPFIANPVTVIAGGQRAAGRIMWSVTPLVGPELHVRAGDSLLISMPADGVLEVVRGSGKELDGLPVLAGIQVPVRFRVPGAHQVRLRSRAGAVLGERQVTAVAAVFPRPIASEIGFARPLTPVIDPPGASVTVVGGSPTTCLASGPDAAGVWRVRPLTMHDARAVARLGGAQGPILDVLTIDAFTISNDFEGGFVYARDAQGFGHGTFSFQLVPRLAYLDIEVDFFIPTASVNGQTRFTVPGSALDAEGRWSAPFILSPGADRTCTKLTVTQP